MIKRLSVGGLSLSAAGLVAILLAEGFSPTATVPVKGDVPTMGFGSTVLDGQAVKVGERITPVRALVVASEHISGTEAAFRESIKGVALYQHEYDSYVDFVYQFGLGAWQKSSMRRALLAGDYAKACGALLRYRYAGGYDCSTLIDGQPNTRCYGVWARQLERHKQCTGAGQ